MDSSTAHSHDVMATERRRLDVVANLASYGDGVNGAMVSYSVSVFSRWFCVGPTLEMGPADGRSTMELMRFATDLELLEGSRTFAEQLKQRFPDVVVHSELFERFRPVRRYRNIVLSHVLEHVDDAPDVMRRAYDWLEPGGIVFAATPNAMSLHRQVGVLAGDLPIENELNAADRSVGHRRVYDSSSLRFTVTSAGFQLLHFGGYFLKTLSNRQLEEVVDPSHLLALMRAGERHPEIAADIYVVARRPLD